MDKKTEALKLALEALEWINRVNAMEYEYQQKARESLNAIYEALAEQPAQQKPVAWLDPWTRNNVTTDYDAYGKHGIPLYKSPQAQRTWVGLTEEEILELNFDGEYCIITDDDEEILEFARSIEATLRSKNT